MGGCGLFGDRPCPYTNSRRNGLIAPPRSCGGAFSLREQTRSIAEKFAVEFSERRRNVGEHALAAQPKGLMGWGRFGLGRGRIAQRPT